jgi:hypothetical protein
MVSISVARHVGRLRAACILSAGVLLGGLAAAPAHAATPRTAPARAAAKARPRSGGVHYYQTPSQAAAQAARTGKPVPVTGSTTTSSTLTANPDGTFTLTESNVPVRAKVHGTWRTLNPDLARNADGTYSPVVSSSPLTLSGGGTGPLATMAYSGFGLSLTAPMRLPAPAVSGATATYAGILPGVDLIITARPSGGYSETLRIASADAAANPALASLTFTTRTTGLALKAAANGTITARTSRGQVIFAAPAPRMWDSATSPRLRAPLASGSHAEPATGMLPRSTATAPGSGAHARRLSVSVAGNRLTLTPDHGFLTGSGAVFPEFASPQWDTVPNNGAANWAYVSSEFPNQPYYDGSDYLQVGEQPDANNNDTGYVSYAFYDLPVSSLIRGAYINDAMVYFPEVWADSCTPSPVDLYQTGPISGATTYNNQPAWIGKLGSDPAAFGWSPQGIGGPSSCQSGAKDVSYSVRSVIATDATRTGAMPDLTVGLKAEAGDVSGWKQFANPKTPISENATMTITYAFQPDKPVPSTSPTADCTTGKTVLGDGNVTLYAYVNDRDGFSMAVTFTAYANGNPSNTFANNSSMVVDEGPGLNAPLELSATDLEHAVTLYGGTSKSVSITWTATAQVEQSYQLTGLPASKQAICTFTFSQAKPGQPDLTDPAGFSCGDPTSPQKYFVGTAVSIKATGNATKIAPANPDSYSYQLNGSNPVTVSASSSSPYAGSIKITPTRITNVLAVTAIAAGNNIGQTAICWINASQPPPATDQDMTGDGVPDLLTVGNGTTSTASGLWLAAGRGSVGLFDGTIAPAATDIAPYGPQGLGAASGSSNTGTPASWNGLNALSGQFLGPGFNDIEAYQPGTDQVYLLKGQGDGSIATSQDTNLTGVFTDQLYYDTGGDFNSDNPLQLANAYDVSSIGSTTHVAYPDQVGIYSDPQLGSFLAYFVNSNGLNSFDQQSGNTQPYVLTNATPDGTMDWASWTIATDFRSGAAYPDMYLWNESTGALYLWQLTGLTNLVAGGADIYATPITFSNPTAQLTGTLVNLSASAIWHKGDSLTTLQGTGIGGQPGILDVTSTGQVESWAWNGTTLTQVNAKGTDQQLLTADHTYLLNDVADDGTAVSTAADQAGAGKTENDLTGHGGTTWNSGDVFSPDVSFDGISGYLSTLAPDFTPSSSFTISAWVDPVALGGTVFSQSGASYSTVKVSSTTGGQWQVAVSTGGSSYATAAGGTARPFTWADLTLTYNSANGADILKLYQGGTEIAALAAAPPANTGQFLIGASQAAGAAGFLNGQVASVQVWDSLATPVQSTPASVFVPITPVRIMDTRSQYQIGPVTGPIGASATIAVPIDGNVTASLPANVSAVAIAVTVTAQTAGGNLVFYPDGTPRPITSNLNFAATGGNTTNDAIVPVGPDGNIAIHNASGGTDQIIVDLTGYFTTASSAPNASTYTPLADPARILDTRNGTGGTQIPAAGTLTLTIEGNNTGGAGIPASGVTSVALNLTAVAPAGDSGYLIVYPDGTARPGVTLLNYGGGASAGTVIIPVAVGGDGKIDIFNVSPTPTNLVGDVSGYFTTSTGGQYYHPLDSTRIIDTRQTTPLGAHSGTTITSPADVTADNPTLVLNITATLGTTSGDLQAYPSSAAQPVCSILNYSPNQDIANLALVNTATANSFIIQNQSSGPVDIVIDTSGYFQ